MKKTLRWGQGGRIRRSTLPSGGTILLRMHEMCDFSVRRLRSLMIAPQSEMAGA
jgi:hypothetical protein